MMLMSGMAAMILGLTATAFEDAKDEKCNKMTFAKKACCMNMTEIKLGKMAAEKAKSSDVKAFAERMVRDHTAAQEALKTACAEGKTECPSEQTKEGKEVCEKCEKLTGKEFDAAYIKFQVDCHEKAIKMLEKASKECDCEKLRAYATKQLPAVKEHQEMAKKLKAKLDTET